MTIDPHAKRLRQLLDHGWYYINFDHPSPAHQLEILLTLLKHDFSLRLMKNRSPSPPSKIVEMFAQDVIELE